MTEVGVHEAKTHLSRLLQRVAGGEEFVITRGGEPVARLISVAGPRRRIVAVDEGVFEVPDDFDAPLPDVVLAEFYR